MEKIKLATHDRIVRIKTDDEDIFMILAPDFYKFDEGTKAVVYNIREEARKLWTRNSKK